MKRYILCLVAALVSSASMWAVVASPEPFEFTKPDGTKVMARMYGDEFHSYIESLDGELLSGSREPAVVEAAAIERRIRRSAQMAGYLTYPTTGSPKSLVLLVGFSDLAFGQTHQDFQDLLTKSGYNHNGATGSCRDYYIASSDSIFSPQFDCFGPFTLSGTQEYYGGNSGGSTSVHAAQMVTEACQMAHNAGVNFKDYDTNNDGVLDNVFIFYAGHNEAEGGGEKTIWPHSSDISYLNIRLDDVLLGSYACTSEYKGAGGSIRCGIGTFCHEFGHVIGQPDFYDTGYNYYSVSSWDVMCSGSYNNGGNTPPTFSAYERFYEGWLKPVQLELPGQYTLSATPFQTEAYLIAAKTHNLSGYNPNPNEFFLLEYRGYENPWDAYLPGHGMLVWHIDYAGSAWTSNTPNNGPTLMRMHLEEANGIGWKQRRNGDDGRPSDPYPGTQNVTTFNPVLHDGTQLAQPIFNIHEAGGMISFTYISKSGSMLKSTEESLEITTTVNEKKNIVDWEPQSFELLGSGLDPEQAITLKMTASNFFIFAGEEHPDRDGAWRTNWELYPQADSTLKQRIWVSYVPKKKNCTPTSGSVSITSTTASLSIPVVGNAPRPVYVVTPTTLANKDVTPYSFTARWKKVDDAEQYYLTLYQVEEGQTEYLQDFENFTSLDLIHDMGWESNTTLTTTSAKADGSRSLYIKNHGDQITTETYPAAITSISFWYNAFAATVDTIGVLEIEAFDGEEWWLVDNMVMLKSSKRAIASYDFTPEDNLRAFRITWMDNGGAGIAFDAFTATTSQRIIYSFKGRELSIAPTDEKTLSHTFTGLTPNNTYFYQVQCTDLDKGCSEHLTALSEPVKVVTPDGLPLDDKKLMLAIDSINYNPAQNAIYLIEPKDGDKLLFYNSAGRLVYSVDITAGMSIYALPLNIFTRGEMYLVQHAISGKLGRKNKWLKFVY